MSVQPIIKWAGGKRWLVKKAPELFPKEFNTYIEPFLGGGAVFFHLKPEKSILSDVNSELINTYNAVKENHKEIIVLLEAHQKKHSEEHYYFVRANEPENKIEQAARMLYLNRTCWNGLYRVNLKGKFNVPIGTKLNILHDIDSFSDVSNLLNKATINISDFEKTIDLAKENDFLFIDPPYTVKHNENGFIKYNENLFSWNDQVRLRDAVIRAKSRKTKIIVLNANHESIRDLYKDFNQKVLTRRNIIAGRSEHRGDYEELAIQI